MAKKAIVRAAAVSFLAGILMSSFFVIPLEISAKFSNGIIWPGLLLLAAGLLLVIAWFHCRLWLVLLAFLFFGAWRLQTVIYSPINTPQQIQGLARVQYREFDWEGQRIYLQLLDHQLAGQMLIMTSRYPHYQYGDVLRINCRPQNFDTEPGKQRYYLRRGISAVCYQAEIFFDHHDFDWRSVFFKFKDYVLKVYNQSLSLPVAALMSGMIMNERGDISQQVINNFSRSGLSHIVAISGMNMTLLVIAGKSILERLNLRRSSGAIFLIIVVMLYTMIIGWPSSAVRAAVMTSAMLVAMIVRRPYDITHVLIMIAAVMAAINPLALLEDLGWQLSFLALAGLIWWTPWWQSKLAWLPERFALRELISVTMAAQMLTWPLILYRFGLWPTLFIPANIVTVPLVGQIMIVGLILPLISWIPIIGSISAIILMKLGQWLLFVVNIVGSLPWAVIAIQFSWIAMVFSYIGMYLLTRKINEKNRH